MKDELEQQKAVTDKLEMCKLIEKGTMIPMNRFTLKDWGSNRYLVEIDRKDLPRDYYVLGKAGAMFGNKFQMYFSKEELDDLVKAEEDLMGTMSRMYGQVKVWSNELDTYIYQKKEKRCGTCDAVLA